MTGAEELHRVADRIAWLFPEEASRLLAIADEHRRMSEALDDLVHFAYSVIQARETAESRADITRL